jgi:hypothetical protein
MFINEIKFGFTQHSMKDKERRKRRDNRPDWPVIFLGG